MEETSDTFDQNTPEEDLTRIINPDLFIQDIKGNLDAISFEIESLAKFVEQDYELLGYLVQFNKIFGFKVGNLMIALFDLEREILSSPVDWYSDLLWGEDRNTQQTQNKIERLVDSILTQYFSVLDIFIKSLTKIKKIGKDIDSLGSLYHYEDKKELDTEEKKVFEQFLINRDKFEEIKAYRDYTIHHGNVNIESTKEGVLENQHPTISYRVYLVKKLKGKTYKQSKLTSQKINVLLRKHISKLMECCGKSLMNIRQEYFEKEEF